MMEAPSEPKKPCPHPTCLVRLDRVTLRYGEHRVFSNLSLRLYRGEHLALIGANGAGKSTLLRLLQGELRPTQQADSEKEQAESGRIYWNFEGNEDPFALSALSCARLVSPDQQQRYARQGWRICGEDIVLSGLENTPMLYGGTNDRRCRQAAELAAAVGAEQLMSMLAPAMSQGQLRLTLLLRALISKPALLLLDEPFEGLDASSRERIMRCISLAAENGSTLLISAHKEEDIPPFISGALLLENGKLRRAGLPLPAQTHTALPLALPAARLPGPLDSSPLPGPPHESPLLELAHVDVFTNRQQVLFDISWSIHRGERWLLSGDNGAGKSTLLRLLYGEEFAACGGTLSWRGGPRPSLESLRSCVGYVSDSLQYAYEYDISAEDVVISGLRGSIGLYHKPEARERALARDWLELMGLSALREENFYSLSSGMSRRVLLARALASSPVLLLLDEPCAGLDAQSRKGFLQGLSTLGARGVSLVLVTHSLQDRDFPFTHELRLDRGKVAFCGRRSAPPE
jgi:molybdate transport system ATP-binding protein